MPANSFVIDIRADLDALTRTIDARRRDQVPFVTAYALTKTAQDAKAELISVMAQVFDRPTRFTLNALYVKPATKRDLAAAVQFKEGFGSIPAWRYLGPEVEGGPRVKKSFERRLERAGILRPDEFCVPGGGAKLDAYGNMRGGDIERILSALGAAGGSGYMANETARSKKRKRNRDVIFVLRGTRAPDGIYARVPGTREARPVLLFIRPPSYRPRFPYYETGRRVIQQRFAHHFREGWARYVTNRAAAA